MRSIILPILVAVGCGGAPAGEWSPLPEKRPTTADYPDQDVVHLLDRVTVEFRADVSTGEPYALETAYSETLVLRDSDHDWGHVGASYHRELHTLVGFEARFAPPKGEPKVIGLDAVRDVSGFSYGSYSDWREVSVSRPAKVGTVVGRRVTWRVGELRMFSFSHPLARSSPVKSARLEVVVPAGWTIDYTVRQLNVDLDRKPTVTERDGKRTHVWAVKDQPGIDSEPMSPPWSHLVPVVRVRLASWKTRDGDVSNFAQPKQVSAYAHQLSAGVREVTPEIRAKVGEVLTGVADDPRAKAHALYDWVRQNVRYVAIELGMGGWVPYPAKQTLSTTYGDCKDKATLLSAMLAAAEIPSRVASVYSHSGYPLRYGLPLVVGNANHAILVIDLPDGPVYADTTDRSVPFGRLPFRDQEADLLPESAAGSDLVRTPASGAEVNWTRVELKLALATDGSARG